MLYHAGTGKHGTAFKNALVGKYNDTSFPNFASFILYMARENKHGYGECDLYTMGGHVMPYHQCCALCDINYDVIGLVEDFDNDFNYITHKGNLTKIRGGVDVVENRADRIVVPQSKWKAEKKSKVRVRNIPAVQSIISRMPLLNRKKGERNTSPC